MVNLIKIDDKYYVLNTCGFCKKEFAQLSSCFYANRKRGHTSYCNKQCSNEGQVKHARFQVECTNCKILCFVSQKSQRNFCSRKCRKQYSVLNPTCYLKYTKEQLEEAVKTSHTLFDVMGKLKISQFGKNYASIRKQIKFFQLDCSHFNTHVKNNQKITDEELFSYGVARKGYVLKERALANKLLVNTCAICGLSDTWQEKPIVLQLDHIDGDNKNNQISNLRILCPNCHPQTDTFCGKNANRGRMEYLCYSCHLPTSGFSKFCARCSPLKQPKINWPDSNSLYKRIMESSYVEVARELGVSDNAIRKHLNNYPPDIVEK